MCLSLFCLQTDDGEATFYSDEDKDSESDSDSDEDEEEEGEEKEKKKKKKHKKKPYVMDSDHRLLLRNSKPLLQSRSAAVCYQLGATMELFFYVFFSSPLRLSWQWPSSITMSPLATRSMSLPSLSFACSSLTVRFRT